MWLTEWILFVVASIFFFDDVRGSERCRSLVPRDITTNDLNGQWYWILATFTELDWEDDCTGFMGASFNATHGTYMVTDRTDYNPVLSASIRNRRVYVEGRDRKCMRKEYYVYQAAIIEDNFICFYFCGGHAENDYAQCFGRSQDISNYHHERLFHGLRYFGLMLAECSLRRVNREFCFNHQAGIGDPLNMLMPIVC